MASSKEYLDFVLEQLSPLSELSYRAIMGEYVLYCHGKVVGGVYDDRLLLKPTAGALRLLRDADAAVQTEIPYPGAREMLLADIDDGALCRSLVEMIAAELPAPKSRRTP